MRSRQKVWDIRVATESDDQNFSALLRDLAQTWASGEEIFWSADEILKSLARPEIVAYFAVDPTLDSGAWAGFLLAERGPFSTDLLYIHVRPASRRGGLGHALLARLVADLEIGGTQEALFLEVRVGNTQAQKLYKDLGMDPVGRRHRYYGNGDDALVFKKEFSKRAP